MKKLSLILLASLTYSTSFSQCDKIFDFKEGSSWTWANYDGKGKLIGRNIQKVEKFAINGDNRSATLAVVMEDKKGEQGAKMSMDMSCEDGTILVDMKKFIPQEYLQSQEAEMKIEATNLEFPATMKVGDKLPDGSVKMAMASSSPMALNLTVDIIKRNVLAEEVLNTPAGEFNCLLLEQTVSTKMMVSMVVKSKEWYTPGVGLIKSESYRKDKLIGYTILTAFTK